MLKPVLLLVSGNAFSSLILLVRNLLVARLISVENYGIAATFAVSMAIVEMMSQLGLQQMIVQDKDGENPALQAGLQGFQALRGTISGVILFVIADPLARFLGIPEVIWAYQLMALVPVLNGFTHFDVFRLQRQMIYLPFMMTIFVPALISVLLIWPLDQLYGDYRVMLYAVLAQGVMKLLTSHLAARQRYRLTLDRAVMMRGLSFGWPLLVNSLLLFLVLNGEKLVVGRELGMSQLALLAMGFTLTLTPTLVLARSVQSFFLPQLSAAQDEDERFHDIGAATVEANILNGLIQVAAVALIGPIFVQTVLGPKYEPMIPLLLWLAILHAVRVFKAGPAVVALARAKTDNAMWANLFRAASLAVSWYATIQGYGLIVVIWIATTAELLGFFVSLYLLKKRIGFPLRRVGATAGLALGFLGVYFGHGWVVQMQQPPMIDPRWTGGAAVVLFILCLASMTALRGFVLRRRTRGKRRNG
ncbi:MULTISPECIES: oligosaccharide flippase family protein [Actibacterium]|uniref:O-antigen/teichoic acid export membrane protein n=1 Tax=Actibacterium naphthalenivorans TaxID=1614693 RepID=A0A840C7V4_9RHOB|nr:MULTISPECIES: oligosaccharide flippase family protein [Actibacterium]MBB4021505.1 O-antigen/teichoic acid export membrane protein [Actibacterium naphthalenivorans]